MRKIIFCASLLVGGCAAQQTPVATSPEPTPVIYTPTLPTPPSEDQIQAAYKPLMICFLGKAILYDDHISGANVIAQAIEGLCPDQWDAWTQMFMNGQTPENAEDFKEELSKPDAPYQIALKAVLIERAYKSKKNG